jgi:DNA polymerase III subunit delta
MNPADFIKAIRKGKRYQQLLIAGEEEFLIREAVNEYLLVAVEPECRDFDYSEFRGRETDGRSLWSALTTLPLIAKQRVVLLDSPNQLEADSKEALKKYLNNPSPTTSLILVQAMQGRERLAFEPSSSMEVVIVPKLTEDNRRTWATDYSKRHGKRLLPEAAVYLMEISGSGLAEIAAKLDHAFLFLGDQEDIDVQTLMKCSGITSEYTVFGINDAIFDQKPTEALKMARSLIEGGEPLLRLLAVQRGTILKLWQVLVAEKDKTGKLMEQIFPRGGQDWYKNKLIRASRHFDSAIMRSAMVDLMEIEIGEKSSSSDTTSRYYEWLWRLASSSARG